MQEFSDFLQQVEVASEYIPNLKIFEFSSKLKSLVDKLPGWFKTKWSTKVQRGNNNNIDATTTLTTQASPIARRSWGTDESKRVFKPLASPDDQRAVSSPKQVFCSYHKTKTHNLNECQKFHDLDFKEQKEFLFKSSFCFNCANANKHIGKNCDQGLPHCKYVETDTLQSFMICQGQKTSFDKYSFLLFRLGVMGAEDQGEESSRHSTSDEDDPVAKAVLPQIFRGKRKVKLALNSSSSCEVLLQKLSDTVTTLGFPATDNAGEIVVSLWDLLSEKLRESETVPYNDWAREWKDQYPDNERQCDKVTVYECAPTVVILTLQKGTTTLTPKKDNQPIQMPSYIREDDFTHPEDGCIHSLDCTGGSLFLFRMIVHSEVRNHQYSMVKIQDSTCMVHDDLCTYEVNLTAELLKNHGGKDCSDSAVSRGHWLGNPANFKGTFCCFGFDVETYHHVTMTLHSLFQSKMADSADFLNGDDLEAILDILEADKEMEEEFINEDENVQSQEMLE
ncbi:hypothetical protein P5673_027442 [Acropora cervicornis]|uniref:Uncharacterized protein n=1 Tax=Acropora cervicornis TaxID=6130 RepID=A0AAD9UW07_ACRCE|nr:hypothetical protein P5673_027442 [Acropora cervicornis]